MPGVPKEHYLMSGYRASGARAIRIDMLERLADMLRGQDSRAGFEATPDMLSITGMTLEQFADLMSGLGYKAERGERPKRRPAPETPAAAEGAEAAEQPADDTAEAATDTEIAADAANAPAAPEGLPGTADGQAQSANQEPDGGPATHAEATTGETTPGLPVDGTDETSAETPADRRAEEEIEVFYTFTWARVPRGRPQGRGRQEESGDQSASRQEGKPHRSDEGGKRGPSKRKPGGPAKGKPDTKPQEKFSAGPKKTDRIDPDNPFAQALMGLRDRK